MPCFLSSFYLGDRREFRNGNRVVGELQSILGRSIEFANPLSKQVAGEEQQIIRLTEEQFQVLDALNRNRRVAVSGCAGSGKTFLALEKARRLAHEGYKTLLTCYNRPLADHLAHLTKGTAGLTIDTFHGFCLEQALAAGLEPHLLHNISRRAARTASASGVGMNFGVS